MTQECPPVKSGTSRTGCGPRAPTMLCRGCGYVLDGLPKWRCPECGRPFDPWNATTFRTPKAQSARSPLVRALSALSLGALCVVVVWVPMMRFLGEGPALVLGAVLVFVGSIVLGLRETDWRGCGWASLVLSAAVPYAPGLPVAIWLLAQPADKGDMIFSAGSNHRFAIFMLIGGLVLTLLLWPLTWFGSLLGMWYARARRDSRER